MRPIQSTLSRFGARHGDELIRNTSSTSTVLFFSVSDRSSSSGPPAFRNTARILVSMLPPVESSLAFIAPRVFDSSLNGIAIIRNIIQSQWSSRSLMSRFRGLVNSPAWAFIQRACRCTTTGERRNCGAAQRRRRRRRRRRPCGRGGFTRERDSHYQFSSNGSAAP